MTRNQSNTFGMFAAVLQYVDKAPAHLKANTLMSAGVNNFNTTKTIISSKVVDQEKTDKQGFTAKKDVHLESLAALAFKMALRLKNYAVSIADAVLLQAVNYSRHSLEQGMEKEVVNRCAVIIQKAEEVVDITPPDFKITPEAIAALKAAILLIEPDTAERDLVGKEHATTTASLQSLFAEATAQLHVLDDLVEGLAEDGDEDFVTGYFAVRKVNHGHGRGGNVEPPKNEG